MHRPFSGYRNIVVLTGAGVSVASGLRPFRGPDGVWTEFNVEEYGHVDALSTQPDKMWQLLGPLRAMSSAARPNAAHRALADFEAALKPDQRFLLVTQNVDGLHQRARSKNVAELHGNIHRTICSAGCGLPMFDDTRSYFESVPRCPHCGAVLRPDIVLFGEPVAVNASWKAKKALRDCDLFLAIGTSGLVSPASNFVRAAQYAGAHTVYVNLEPLALPNHEFAQTILGRAEDLLPRLLTH